MTRLAIFFFIIIFLNIFCTQLSGQEIKNNKVSFDSLSCEEFVLRLKNGITQKKPYLCYHSNIDLLNEINNRKDCFIGMSFEEIIKIFGNPSIIDYLGKHESEKFYVFDFSDGTTCINDFAKKGKVLHLNGHSINISFRLKKNRELDGLKNIKFYKVDIEN